MIDFIVYVGLFFVVFVVVIIFFMQFEVVFVGLFVFDSYFVWFLVIVVSIGNVLGFVINWGLG